MKVEIAEHAGSCFGVKRALELTYEAASKSPKPVCTYGPLIHNPRVIADLKEMGIEVVDRVQDLKEGTLVIRSHGATPDVYKDAQNALLTLVDATCPHVLAAQKAVCDLAGKGLEIIVVGEHDHPEVAGICAQAPQNIAAVVEEPQDLPGNLPPEIGVVVQTTQSAERLDRICVALDEMGCKIELKRTICNATNKRQLAAIELAQRVDAMVVVGGYNSGNTRRLAELCSKYCRTVHIEDVRELLDCDLSACSCVGVTAGASTLDSHIDEVRSYLEQL